MNTLRKICSAIVILAMLVGFLPVGVQSASAADSGFNWQIENSSGQVTSSGTSDPVSQSNLMTNTLVITGGTGSNISTTGIGGTLELRGGIINASGNISSAQYATITSGTIKVTGEITAVQTITISGGNITANGISIDTYGDSFTLALNITGGVVDVGSITIKNSGTSNANSTFTVNGNSAVVFADTVSVTAGGTTSKNYQNGVVFEGTNGTVYGNVTLPDGVTIPEDYTLTIPSGASLTVPSGTTLTNEGTINVSGGTFTNNGTIEDYGTITGQVGGSGFVKVPATVTMNNATATYGSTVTLTANVTGGSGAVNDGTVTFYQGTDTTSTPLNSGGATVSSGTATYELTLTGTNWKPSDSPYTITAVYSGGTDLLSSSDDATLTVSKGTQTTPPDAPIIATAKTNSVTLTAVSGSNIEYGYTTGTGGQPGNWQTETTFNNLSAGTDYTFYTRYAETDYYEASDPSTTGLTVTTQPDITTTSLDAGYVGVQYQETLEASAASGKTVTWALASGSTLPDGLTLNENGTITGTPSATATSHSFTVQATIQGGAFGSENLHDLASLSITISAGTPDITANTYKGEDQTSTFNYGDTITVSGKIAASSQAPGNGINAIAEPAQNQVGLYFGDNQLATADVNTTDDSFTLEYDTAGKGISIGEDQTLTVKYGGSTDQTSGSTNVTITLNKKPVTVTFTGSTTKVYDETTAAPSDLTVALSNGDVVGDDNVTLSYDSITYDNANVGEDKTITASGITLSGGDADWYSLSSDTATTTGSITKQAQDAPAEDDGYTIDYTAETITVTDDTYELSATNGEGATGSERLSLTPGTDVYIRLKATTTHDASAWTTVNIPSRPSAPQNVRGGTNSITNVNSTMAYSVDGETWTAITGNRVTNLRAGSYLVRSQATDSAFASESASVTVRDYVAPPTTPSEPEKPSGPSTGDSDGWTSILDEILDAEDGDTITIDMNGETEVPGEIFEAVADRNVTVIFEMGEDVSWTVDGNDVPTDTAFDTIDLGVSMNTDGIPVDVINAITGEATSVQITLAHDGDFGFALTLSAPLGEENAGYWANLYHYKVNGGEADREDPLGDDEDAEAMDFETAALIDDDGTAQLRMTHASQYAIVIDDHPHETVLPFTDVNANDWFYDPVVWAYGQGLMTGTSDTTFEPNTSTTRAMIVAILNRLEGGPTADGGNFTDVADGDWYAEAVNWAASVGIVAGFEDGSFRPNAPITREQMAAILYNYAQWKGYDVSNRADLSRYSDQPSPWATDVMQWAVGEGLISGTSATTLDPQGTATRAQVAAILQRFLEN